MIILSPIDVLLRRIAVTYRSELFMTPKKPRGREQARMADVARVAGVAPITVSRALSFPESVAPETRKRIDAAVKAVGYLRNSVAGSLKSQRTKLIVAVIPSITHQFLATMIQGLSEVLAENGFHLILGTSGESLMGEEVAVRAFLAQKPCAIVLHNTAHTEDCRQLLALSQVPIIETGDLTEAPLDSTVGYSNFDAARSMTRHLIGRGYKRVAFVGRTAELNERTEERVRGYRAAMQEAGLSADEDLVVVADPGVRSGAAVITRLVEMGKNIDAVFFAGDLLAAGALLECQRQGWNVPERIAVAGYDDSELGASLHPALTTLHIPRYEIGREAAQIALRRMAGGGSERRDLGFDLRIREST
jgi:LacI family gluconate utilization system Gnt-I transcriptional repressor